MENREFWFVVGSQFLYGPEVLEIVDKRAAEMTVRAGHNIDFLHTHTAFLKQP